MTTEFFHFGISVSNIEIAIKVLVEEFGLNVQSRRKVDHEYIGRLIGVEGATCEIVMIDAGNNTFIELLDWSLPARDLAKQVTLLSQVGAMHICLYVKDINSILEKVLVSKFSELIGEGSTTVPIGPNSGAKVAFVKSFDGIFIELFQKKD